MREQSWKTVEYLIKLSKDLPIQLVPIDSLIESVRRGKWFRPGQIPTIGDILDHVERAMNADAHCPIILSSESRVMDGSHRVVAASIRGDATIRAVRFSENPAPQYVEKIDSSVI